MSKVVRSVKNVTKGYSSVQVKVRNGMRDPLFLVWIFGVNTPRLLHLRLVFLSPCHCLLAYGSHGQSTERCDSNESAM